MPPPARTASSSIAAMTRFIEGYRLSGADTGPLSAWERRQAIIHKGRLVATWSGSPGLSLARCPHVDRQARSLGPADKTHSCPLRYNQSWRCLGLVTFARARL